MPSLGRGQAALTKFVRQQHPQDRHLPPFLPFEKAAPYSHPRRPRSFQELRERLGDYGPLAVCAAELSAVARWVHDDAPELSEPVEVAALCVKIAMDEVYSAAELPLQNGKERENLMPGFSPEIQDEARRVFSLTFSGWEEAGRPYLSGERISKTYSYTMACIRKKERNTKNDGV